MAPVTDSLIAPLAFSLINAITGKWVKKAQEVQESGFLYWATFLKPIARMRVTRAWRRYTVDSLKNGYL